MKNYPKFLVIGGGAVVSEFYLPALSVLGYAENALIIDSSVASLNLLQNKFPQVKVQSADFKDFLASEVLSKELFDAVIIALPNWLHEEAVSLAIKKGLDVLCEKPLSLTTDSCQYLHNLASSEGRILSVGMVRRLIPAYQTLKSALSRNKIGCVQSVRVEFGGAYGWLSDSGAFFKKENGGVLADMGVHYLDLISDLFGKLEPLNYSDDANGGVEANCEFKLRSHDGIKISLKLSRTHTLKNQAVIKGELGELRLELNTFDRCFWTSTDLKGELYPTQNFQYGNWPPNFTACFAEQFAEFAHVIATGQKPRVCALDAAHTIGLIEWAYAQAPVVTLPSPPSAPNLTFISSPICVTGATGFIGEHLVERLYHLGARELICPVRGYRSCQGVARFPVKMPRLNLLDIDQVRQTIAGTKYVFHLAYGNSGPDNAKITIQGTQNIVEAAISAGVDCVVVLSTMYVFGHPGTDQLVDESYPYNPIGGEYGKSKAEMEKWCLQRANTSGKTRIVVLNPSCVYGPRGKTYTRLPFELASQGNFCWIEDGKGIVNYVYIDNLLDAILLAADEYKAHGESFLITDGYCPWKDFLTPLLGSYAESLPSYSRKDLENLEKQKLASLKDLIFYIATDRGVLNMINRVPTLSKLKSFISNKIPTMQQMMRSGVISVPTHESLLFGSIKSHPDNIPPIWLSDLFDTASTRFSAQKAQNILGWNPVVNLNNGHTFTKKWLSTIYNNF